jgi:hypothetical protein
MNILDFSEKGLLDKHTLPWKGEPFYFKVPTLEEIRQARRKRHIISMLCVYGDDSSDEKGVRTFAVAGIAGTQEEWDAIKPAWVACSKGKIFHATDCEPGYGDYQGIPKDECLKEYKRLTEIIAKTNMMGVGVAVDIAAFKDNLPDSIEDAPYYHCFSRVVMGFAELGYLSIPREKVKFVFDQNTKVKYNSILMLEYLSSLSEYNYSEYIDKGEIGFALSREKIEIQAADLFAHETMKYLDNQLIAANRSIRKSLENLLNTGRFKCYCYERGYFEAIKNRLEYLEKEDNSWSEEYKNWLLKRKLSDNNSNRIRYLINLNPVN